MKNEIILFENQGVKLEVNMKDETVWLSLEQMAKLFDRDRTVITRHINNVFKDKELDKREVCAKFAHTTQHGAIAEKTQTHIINYYNLDMIISVGYRVKSQNGVLFRKWATSVLKDYMLKGYAVNQKRLEYLEKTVKLIDIANRMDEKLEDSDAKEILKVIGSYSKALDLLDDYDHKTIRKPKGNDSDRKIKYEDCKTIILDIYQTFDGKEVYQSIEEKASNFLYMIVKNHVFIDGNKRIAATLFIYFLNFYDILYKNDKELIDNNTLAALTLLIAESNPKEKEMMIDLIMNFLN